MQAEIFEFQESPALRLKSSHGSEAVVMLHGAHVVSWKPAGGEERIYLSDKADFSPGSAIRGGIPVCFPQFSSLGDAPFHGFARNMEWHEGPVEDDGDIVRAAFTLSNSPESQALWPHSFSLVLTISLGATSLDVALSVANTGTAPFSFTTALHTYFRVHDIEAVGIEGLQGTTYLDKVKNIPDIKESRSRLTFAEQVDSVYRNARPELILHEKQRKLTIRSRNMPDAVIWNPWVERSQAIADLPDDAYRHMVCIEAGAITTPITLEPGRTWKGSQTMIA